MNCFFEPIPLGKSIPVNNPHAVSVSLPTIANVIGYEENNPTITRIMECGYPRFFKNKWVQELENYVKEHFNIQNKIIISITSVQAQNLLQYVFNETFESVTLQDVCFLLLPENYTQLPILCKMIQHIGCIVSSRKAEQILIQYHKLNTIFAENRSTNTENVTQILAHAYQVTPENVLITNSGTNAVFSAIETLTAIKRKEGKILNVQLGWLYLDTNEIIKKRSDQNYIFVQTHSQADFENWLLHNHHQVANVITETITNPTLQCVDIPWISELCQKYNIGLIVDNTLATPFTVNITQYCDIVVESLTKFACGNADVLMGAIIINPKSTYAITIQQCITDYILPPFVNDLERMAYEITDYESRVKKTAQNTLTLYNYLKNKSYMSQIHSIYSPDSWQAFLKIRKDNTCNIGLISIVFDKPLADYYDQLNFAKGPSLGTEFTLAMPYAYLAHYDLLKTSEGKTELIKQGVHPEILRISVGIEPIELILEQFKCLQ